MQAFCTLQNCYPCAVSGSLLLPQLSLPALFPFLLFPRIIQSHLPLFLLQVPLFLHLGSLLLLLLLPHPLFLHLRSLLLHLGSLFPALSFPDSDLYQFLLVPRYLLSSLFPRFFLSQHFLFHPHDLHRRILHVPFLLSPFQAPPPLQIWLPASLVTLPAYLKLKAS